MPFEYILCIYTKQIFAFVRKIVKVIIHIYFRLGQVKVYL